MVDGLVILDTNALKRKYIRQIVILEKKHPKQLQESKMSKYFDLMTDDAICVIYLINDNIVGECIASPLEKMGPGTLDSITNLEKYLKEKTLYICSITVNEEIYTKENMKKFNGMSVATQMNALVGKIAKEKGYRYIVGHSREGMSVNVAVKLGARVIHEYTDWGRTGASYYQIEVDLKK